MRRPVARDRKQRGAGPRKIQRTVSAERKKEGGAAGKKGGWETWKAEEKGEKERGRAHPI